MHQRLPSRDDLQGLAPVLAPAIAWALVPAALFALVARLVLNPSFENLDRGASAWLQGPAHFSITVIGAITQELFSAEVIVAATVIGVLLLLIKRRWLLALSLAAVVPVMAMEVILKYIIQQPPASSYLKVRLLFSSVGGPAALEHGFPSGHASRAAFVIGWLALALAPARFRPAALSGSAVVTLFVCWTRIYVGDHSILEIIAGIILALMFLIPAGSLCLLARKKA